MLSLIIRRHINYSYGDKGQIGTRDGLIKLIGVHAVISDVQKDSLECRCVLIFDVEIKALKNLVSFHVVFGSP